MSDYQSAQIEAAEELRAHEFAGDTPYERRLFKFFRAVEKALGLVTYPNGAGGIDGDEDEDGYCLDLAMDAFDAGQTVQQYAANVRAKPQFKGAPV